MVFSAKTVIGPVTSADGYTYGGIAKALSDVAIAAWLGEDSAGMWVRAIRYGETPTLGPLTKVDAPSSSTGWVQVFSVHPGHNGSVYIVAQDYDLGTIILGVSTVNPVDLSVATIWHTTGIAGSELVAASWPSERILFVLDDSTTTGVGVRMFSMTSGSLIGTLGGLPFAAALAFNTDTSELLAAYDSGATLSLAVTPVTPSGFGATGTPVTIAAPNPPWVYATATPSGFAVLVCPDFGPGPYPSSAPAYLYTLAAGSLSAGTYVGSASDWTDGHYSDRHDIASDRDKLIVSISSGSPLAAEAVVIESDDSRAWSSFVYGPNLHTLQTAVLAPGKYVTLVIGNILDDTSYGEAIWCWGSPVVGAPPLRQFPRNDGLAGSARRSWPPPRSTQRSQRRAGGYL